MPALARTVRPLALLAGAIACLLSLTGCLKVDATIDIDADAKASGTIGFEFAKQAASVLGISSLADFEAQMKEGTDAQDLAAFGTCATSETEAGYAYTCTFTDKEFTTEGELWTITANDDQIVFHVVSEGQSAEDNSLLGDASVGDVTIDVTFPGPIQGIEGTGAEKTSETSARIQAAMTDSLDVTVTSARGNSAAWLPLVWVALAIVAVLVAVVVIVLLTRRRSASSDEGTPDAAVDERYVGDDDPSI